MALNAPLKPLRCNNPDCTLADGGRCARLSEFSDPLANCPDLARGVAAAPRAPSNTSKPAHTPSPEAAAQPAESPAQPTGSAAPWSGRHLDPTEAERLLWRTPARLIGVLGSYNVGKTCLLTSLFLQLANGQRASFPYRFASSLTLHGFRDLMERANQWSAQEDENIVPHTSIGADALLPRSFLHVGLRPERLDDDRHIDVLLSDIPGEWVKAWTGHATDAASRHMAFIQRCDAIIVVADAGALMEKGGGRTDNDVSLLIRRIADNLQGVHPRPPLALVLSKFDRVVRSVLPPPPEKRLELTAWGELSKHMRRIWLALDEARRVGLPVDIFPVSAFPHSMAEGQPVGVMAPFTYVMKHADNREHWGRIEVPIPEHARGFDTLRRRREEP